jgi:hypothetical protein
MRATDPLNRTFRHKTKKPRMTVVKEKRNEGGRVEKRPIRVETVCPHCGKKIAITIR